MKPSNTESNHQSLDVPEILEAVVRRCSVCEVFKNSFLNITSPVAASDILIFQKFLTDNTFIKTEGLHWYF